MECIRRMSKTNAVINLVLVQNITTFVHHNVLVIW